MTNPNPIALAIATALEAILTPIMATLTAPIIDRIDKLEDVAHTADEPDPDGNKFAEQVMKVLHDRSASAVDLLIDEINERAEVNKESLSDTVAEIIRNGSFSISFTRY